MVLLFVYEEKNMAANFAINKSDVSLVKRLLKKKSKLTLQLRPIAKNYTQIYQCVLPFQVQGGVCGEGVLYFISDYSV